MHKVSGIGQRKEPTESAILQQHGGCDKVAWLGLILLRLLAVPCSRIWHCRGVRVSSSHGLVILLGMFIALFRERWLTKMETPIGVVSSSSLLHWRFSLVPGLLTVSLACLRAFHSVAQPYMDRTCQRSFASPDLAFLATLPASFCRSLRFCFSGLEQCVSLCMERFHLVSRFKRSGR